jgi:uncharacterized protein
MIRIGTAEANSTFLTQGQTLAKVLQRHHVKGPIDVLISPAASIDNANRLDCGEIEFGFMAANWIGRAKRGHAPFARKIDLRLVAPMNLGPLFFIARVGSGIETFDDLAGKRVCVGPEGSGMTQHAHTILGALGHSLERIEPVYLSFADGAEALRAGSVDAQLQCPIPNPVMTALDDSLPLRVVTYSSAQIETILDKVPFYRKAVMRKGQLNALKENCEQPGVLNVLVAHARTESSLVAQVANVIAHDAKELGRENALFETLDQLMQPYRAGNAPRSIDGVGVHGGAVKA